MTLTRPSNAQSGLFQIPNEILFSILSAIPTPSLLPLTVTCTRIHDLIIRILHRRLLLTASLPNHKLILECYHPASKFTEPYLLCEYLSTPGLSSSVEGEGLVYEASDHSSRLSKLGGLYSQFRPLRREEKRTVRRQHPAGGQLPVWTAPGQLPPEERDARAGSEFVAHRVSLDPEDMFSQLCVVTNLVKMGPHNGVFENLVTVSDGLVRIGRRWLAERAGASGTVLDKRGKDAIEQGELEGEQQINDIDWECKENRTLWLSNKTNIGLTVRIKERKWKRTVPVLLHQDEEPAVSYTMEYEMLLIRTTHLLLAVEESMRQEQAEKKGKKAIVFGTFVNR